MLDLRVVRAEPERVRAGIAAKGVSVDLDALLAQDERRRAIITEVEAKKARKNATSIAIGKRRTAAGAEGNDTMPELAELRELNEEIRLLDVELRGLDASINQLLLSIPNLPHSSVPLGPDESANVEVSRHGVPPAFDFEPLPHWEIGTRLDILDFERGAKVGGARAVMYKGGAARLERALINMMLDLHTREHGYREIYPPYLVLEQCMIGTGQLPKFGEDSFRIADSPYWLNPTAEVPGTNMYRDEILDETALPVKHVAFATSFRSEIGSYGKDTKGLIRLHQFNKVELLKWTTPESSYEELNSLLRDAATVLEKLGLAYRVLEMCTGDLGFTATKKYDLEVWLPSYNRYVEISSCSNFEDFQARRINIRYRPTAGGKLRLVHTLNGSGLAIGRTVAAILENYQLASGAVAVPAAVQPYMDGISVIER
jgi:seryl-tRNA synthetase